MNNVKGNQNGRRNDDFNWTDKWNFYWKTFTASSIRFLSGGQQYVHQAYPQRKSFWNVMYLQSVNIVCML